MCTCVPSVLALLFFLTLPLGCRCAETSSPAAGSALPRDPTQGVVPLPCADGWTAALVHDAGVGVWDVRIAPVFGRYGCPQIVAQDDLGRLTMLISYSGKWTPKVTVHDGQWLGPVAQADLDPRAERAELYTGGQSGVLYQVRPEAYGGSEVRRVANFPGEEIHTLLAGQLDRATAGEELWIFTHAGPEDGPGMLRTLAWDGEVLRVREVAALEGRVRDAVLLDASQADGATTAAGAPWVLTASRSGELALYAHDGEGMVRSTLLREPMGLGRLAVRAGEDGRLTVYAGRDDGVVLRVEGRLPVTGEPLPADGDDEARRRVPGVAEGWVRERVFAGAPGVRGVAAGRFDRDPALETVAIHGYDGRVQLLERRGTGPWSAETLFTDVDKGHWLTAGELDGRNATDELIATGYSGRIVLLARPAGYGLEGVAGNAVP